jgi:hypothetical protein
MTVTDYVVSALAGLTLIGVCVLAAYGQSTAILTPILTALIAFILGKKNVEIADGARLLGGKLRGKK